MRKLKLALPLRFQRKIEADLFANSLLYNDGTKNICVGPLGIVAGVAVFSLAFVPAVILASKGKGCAPTTGAVDSKGNPVSNKPLSSQDKVLTVTQAQISALDKRDANPDAELSGDGYMSLAPRAENLDSRSSVSATSAYYSWTAHGRNSCSTTMSTSDYTMLINDHIGKMMKATGATCGRFVINNSGTYSLNLNIAFCDLTYCYTGCWYR